MNLHLSQLCLRVMLWSLGASAAIGVGMIFASDSEVMGRLLGTSAATAGAAALMWPMTRLADQAKTRVAGLAGMALVLLDFIVLLVVIWGEMLFRYSPHYVGEGFFLTLWFVLLAGGFAVGFLAFLENPEAWLAARAGVALSGVAFVELMIGVWLPRDRYAFVVDYWAAAAGATALFGILGVACMVSAFAERPWRWTGVLASLVGWLMLTVHIFREVHTQLGESVFVVVTTVAAAVAHANLSLLPKLSPQHEIFRLGTIALAILTAVLVNWILLGEIYNLFAGGSVPDLLARVAAAAGIVTACGTVAILVLALIHRSHVTQMGPAIAWTNITITCPACGLGQTVPLGNSSCSQCGLPIFTRVGQRRA